MNLSILGRRPSSTPEESNDRKIRYIVHISEKKKPHFDLQCDDFVNRKFCAFESVEDTRGSQEQAKQNTTFRRARPSSPSFRSHSDAFEPTAFGKLGDWRDLEKMEAALMGWGNEQKVLLSGGSQIPHSFIPFLFVLFGCSFTAPIKYQFPTSLQIGN
jgi:hypothetical protein